MATERAGGEGVHNFLRNHVMVTYYPNGRRIEASYEDAIVWISRNVRSASQADAVRSGVPIRMTNDTQVIFEKIK